MGRKRMSLKKLLPLVAAAAPLMACAPRQVIKLEQATSATETRKVESKYTGPKRRIGVVDFAVKSGYGDKRLGTAASDVLITELAKTGKFVVVEREKLDKLMEEQKLQAAGPIDPRTVANVGKVLGLNAIVTGAVSEFGVKSEGGEYLIVQSKRQTAEASSASSSSSRATRSISPSSPRARTIPAWSPWSRKQ